MRPSARSSGGSLLVVSGVNQKTLMSSACLLAVVVIHRENQQILVVGVEWFKEIPSVIRSDSYALRHGRGEKQHLL